MLSFAFTFINCLFVRRIVLSGETDLRTRFPDPSNLSEKEEEQTNHSVHDS